MINRVELGDVKELNLVLKADVQGSLEAIRQSLERLVDEDAKVRVLHTGVGAVTESDVLLSSASDGIIISFAIGSEPSAERLADRMGVEIRPYNIIYQLIDDIELALHGMLEPVYTEVVVGRAEIREIYARGRHTQIAGCRVTDGRMVRNGTVRVTREGAVVGQSTISSLRNVRDDVNEMNAGTECGIILQAFNDFQTGDILEVLPPGTGAALSAPPERAGILRWGCKMPRRLDRVNELLRSEISHLIARQIKDPRVAGVISVTEVIAAGDLRSARVYISVMGRESDRLAALDGIRVGGVFPAARIARAGEFASYPAFDFCPGRFHCRRRPGAAADGRVFP